jgi:alkylation response protein AidB-like acyl-CoA dehydrogenase
MDFDFSPAQYELQDEARRFLAKECPTGHVREFIEDQGSWSKSLWKQIADLGWMALPFPEEYGGLGQGFLDLVLLLEELGASLAPVPFLSSVVLAGHAVLHHGSEDQRARWLPDIATGDRVAAAVLPAFEHDVDTPAVRADGARVSGERASRSGRRPRTTARERSGRCRSTGSPPSRSIEWDWTPRSASQWPASPRRWWVSRSASWT